MEFLSLTYNIFMMAGKKDRLSLKEVNDLRKMMCFYGDVHLYKQVFQCMIGHHISMSSTSICFGNCCGIVNLVVRFFVY